MNRLFIRESQGRLTSAAGNPIDKVNIAVTGLGQNVGTTFVASSLAFYFAEKGNNLTFTQCLTPSRSNGLLYDAVAMDQRFHSRTFVDFYDLIKDGKPIKDKKNIESGINWRLPTPWDCEKKLDLDQEQKSRLIQGARSQICVYDFEVEEDWDKFLLDMDVILVVVDPLPSKLIRHSGRFKQLKQMELAGAKVKWLVNRVNAGINRRQVSGYLKSNDLILIEEFPIEAVYADEFFCRFNWQNHEIRCKLMDIFTKVSHEMDVL